MIDHRDDVGPQTVDQAQELAALALRYSAIAGVRIAEAKEQVKAYVNREPVRALGIALGVGIVIGWLAKRR